MKRLICLSVFLTSISCESSKNGDASNSNSKDTIATDPAVVFDKEGAVEMLNFKRTNDYPSSETDTAICRTWSLSSKDIEKLIKECTAINRPDWHHLFEHLPCSITGKLRQGNKTFDFQVNGGAWLTITATDTTMYFGYFKNDGDKLFLSTPMNTENEE